MLILLSPTVNFWLNKFVIYSLLTQDLGSIGVLINPDFVPTWNIFVNVKLSSKDVLFK